MRTRWVSFLLTAAAALGLAPHAASAQQSTTATYFDWLLQCASDAAAVPPKKVCGIYQTTLVQGKNVTFSRVGIEGTGAQTPKKLIVQVPVNVSFRGPVEIHSADSSELAVSGPFDRCLPTGCFAELDVREDVLRKWKDTEGVSKIAFKDASGRTITLPLSFKGFRPALEALARE